MSRIQHILDKADREGVIRRVRTVADAPAVATETATLEADPTFATRRVAIPTETAITAGAAAIGTAVPTAAPSRVVQNARLHPVLVAAASGTGVASEQYRALRTRIVNADHRTSNVVLVTSPGRAEGKSVTASNLALTMAQEYQRRACIIDADLRSPQIARLFGIADGPGLSDVLLGTAQLEDVLVTIEEYQITVLPAGRASTHPAELLGTTAMRRTLETLRSQFDRVVIDTPAVNPLADVGILTPLVDSVVLVVRAGVTATPAIHDALAAIDGGKLLGIVLNQAA
jgi:capsular exopolysaccharide synthesis family protein